MRTTAVLLLMIGAATVAHAHPADPRERYAHSRAETALGPHGGRTVIGAPMQDRYGCNGGPCTLTGGPSGGPNQT